MQDPEKVLREAKEQAAKEQAAAQATPPPTSALQGLSLAPAAGARNHPGNWKAMVSYTQKSHKAKHLAEKLKAALEKRGFTVWLDIYMDDKSEAAMKEAVENSEFVIAIITDDGGEGNAYFERPFCLSELRWAIGARKYIQPVIDADDKKRIGELMTKVPADLGGLRGVDWVDLNTTDNDYFEVGIKKILDKAGKGSKDCVVQ